MSGFDVYKTYLALKLHFSKDNYNFFTFRGKSRVSVSSYEKRNDKYFFKKLALKYDEQSIVEFFVSHFIDNDQFWIGSVSVQNSVVYNEWKKRIQSLSFQFQNEIDKLLEEESNFDKLFETNSGHPIILRQFISGKLSVETMVILNKILNYVSVFDKKISEPIVWPILRKKIVKYEPFLTIDTTKYKRILYDKVCSSLITT
jgi:hypothetical protein